MTTHAQEGMKPRSERKKGSLGPRLYDPCPSSSERERTAEKRTAEHEKNTPKRIGNAKSPETGNQAAWKGNTRKGKEMEKIQENWGGKAKTTHVEEKR